MFRKNDKWNGFKMPLNMKNINNFTQQKMDQLTFTHTFPHRKRYVQSRRSTQSALNISSTLRVFTNQPIREQEIKKECMNLIKASILCKIQNSTHFLS